MKLTDAINSTNIAKDLDEDKLKEISELVINGFESDLQSRSSWEEALESWTKLALQVADKKTFPWQGAANVKYPLLATAAMQFAARAYPTLVPSDGKIVKCKVIGYDPDGQKTARAERVSKFLSWQVMEDMDDWEEDMDKLLLTLPIAGTCFKKTYWSSAKQQNCSHLILPKHLIVDYYTKKLHEAERITEVIYLSKRLVQERINQEIYLDVDLGDPQQTSALKTSKTLETLQKEPSVDGTTPYTILEQHTFLDLDDDGYAEPYIVTIEENSKKILRIVARFNQDGVVVNEKNKVISIEPIQYYTKYGFIPNPDGGFYDIGFGSLLGPLNESANTLINQLIDAGSLSNLQAGFIGKGLRIKMGNDKFVPGEWKSVNAVGDDLKKQIFPLPVREPSQVLFNLLDLLLKSGKELASVAEIFVGKMPGQNTPATTTMATIEQGMKVFTAVYKRIYRSLTEEFRKLYRLNKEYLNDQTESEVLSQPLQASDFDGPEHAIVPAADPNSVSSQEKQAKVKEIMQLMQLGTINPMAVTKLYLEAFEITQPEQYMMQPQPQPDPKMEAVKAKAQVDQQKAALDGQMAEHKMQLETVTKEQEAALKEKQMNQELQMKAMQAVLDAHKSQAESSQKLQQQAAQHQLDMVTQAQSHAQAMQHQREAGALKNQQLRQQPKKGNVNNGNKPK